MKTQLYNGQVELNFDKKRHIYTLNGRWVPNVTTVTGIIDKPALVAWAANTTIEYIRTAVTPGRAYSEHELAMIFGEAAHARYRSSQAAMSIGTEAHDWIESYIKARILKLPVPAQPENPPVARCTRAFLKWCDENKIEFVSSERKVMSMKEMFCGTLDILADYNDSLAVIDIKTSSGIYDEYFLQVAAYAKALMEEMGFPIEMIGILKVPKDADDDLEFAVTSDIDELYDVFLAALRIWNWKNSAKIPRTELRVQDES